MWSDYVKRLKTVEKYQSATLKVIAVAYETGRLRQTPTIVISQVRIWYFGKGGRLQEVVA